MQDILQVIMIQYFVQLVDALFTTHSFSAQQGASLPPSGEKLFSREREREPGRGGEWGSIECHKNNKQLSTIS